MGSGSSLVKPRGSATAWVREMRESGIGNRKSGMNGDAETFLLTYPGPDSLFPIPESSQAFWSPHLSNRRIHLSFRSSFSSNLPRECDNDQRR